MYNENGYLRVLFPMEDIVEFSSEDEAGTTVQNCFHLQMRKIATSRYPQCYSKRHTGGCISLNIPAPMWKIPCKSLNLVSYLTDEIIAYAEFMRPSEAEMKIRDHIMATLKDIVSKLFVDAKLHAFGSTATHTVLAKGDIDLVIAHKVKKDNPLTTLEKFQSHLKRHKEFTGVNFIRSAKVPIVKFVHAQSGIFIDVSCDQMNGLSAALTMNEILKNRPFHPLLYVLKALLREHKLNEVRTGGFGSFALTIMICGFLNSHPITSDPKCLLDRNYGVILLEFLETIGRNMNTQKLGLSLNGFVSNNTRGFLTLDPDLLNNNVTGGPFSFREARSAMYLSFCKLTDAIYLHTSQIRWHFDEMTQKDSCNYDKVFLNEPQLNKQVPTPKTLLGYILDSGYDMDKWHKTMARVHQGIEKSSNVSASFDGLDTIDNFEKPDEPYFVAKKRKHSDEIISLDNSIEDITVVEHQPEEGEVLTAKKPKYGSW